MTISADGVAGRANYTPASEDGVSRAAAVGGLADDHAPVVAGTPIERQQAIPLSHQLVFDGLLTA